MVIFNIFVYVINKLEIFFLLVFKWDGMIIVLIKNKYLLFMYDI